MLVLAMEFVKRRSLHQGSPARQQVSVAIAAGSHPFPFRTRKLSPPAPMVLGWRRPGRVGRRRISPIRRPRRPGPGPSGILTGDRRICRPPRLPGMLGAPFRVAGRLRPCRAGSQEAYGSGAVASLVPRPRRPLDASRRLRRAPRRRDAADRRPGSGSRCRGHPDRPAIHAPS